MTDRFEIARDLLTANLLKAMRKNVVSYVQGFSKTDPIDYHEMQSYLRMRFMSYAEVVAFNVPKANPNHGQVTMIRAGMNHAITEFLPELTKGLVANGVTILNIPKG